MTNDGDFANLIAHPSTHVPKVYRVTVRPGVTEEQLTRLAVGVEIDGRMTAPASVRVLEQQPGRVVLEFVLHEGRNRQIRNMCEAVGLEVARLKRTAIGAVKLGMLPQGRFRDLTPDEVRRLRAAAQKKGNAQNIQREEEKQNAANRTNGGKKRKGPPCCQNAGAPDNGRVLVMTDGEETLGLWSSSRLKTTRLSFYGFSVSGQTDFTKAKPDPMTIFVLDTLMRSAASFGETNGMNHIRTRSRIFLISSAARVCGCGRSRRKRRWPHRALRIKPKMPQSETSLCGIASKLPRAAACGVLFFAENSDFHPR